MKTLTQRQNEILTYIEACRDTDGLIPTMRDIAEHFGFRSVSTAREHIQALCRKGVLNQTDGRARALQVTRPNRPPRRPLIDIPVFGDIPAGTPDTRDQQAEGCITVDVDTLGLRPTARTFALRVSGESMIGRHIMDGDHVICEHGMTPNPGDIVAALIDNESTLKTYLTRRNAPYLKAENPKYPELIPATELVIQGVVVAVIRKCTTSNTIGKS
jgi:repressor LexA